MAITLRTVTGSALSHVQVDTNFSSLIYSGSISGNQLTLHYTGSGFAPTNLVLPITSASFASTSSITLAIGGTSNRVPVFTGTRTLGDSNIVLSDPQVHINPTSTLANSAILQIDSTEGGVLFPRMTSTQRTDIVSPAEGLVVWDTTLRQLCIRVSTNWYTFDLTVI